MEITGLEITPKPKSGGKSDTTIDVLGTRYTVRYRDYDDEPAFAKQQIDGFCDNSSKTLTVGNLATFPNTNVDDAAHFEAGILRHEVIHAFLYESGLSESSSTFGGAWAQNEEMVDWFAIQSPKIYNVFRKLGVI